MHSHHSHSGDYVAHGVDGLEAIVTRVSELGFDVYCMTEHMPRIDQKYLYPEEITGDSSADLKLLQQKFIEYLAHATKVKNRGLRTEFIIGMEVEGCDLKHIDYAQSLMQRHSDVMKFCVGSVHHVNQIPLDFDQQCWYQCLKSCGNSVRQLMVTYLELQFELLTRLKPQVVGHFDLFRLYCPNELVVDSRSGERVPDGSEFGVRVGELSLVEQWPEVKSLALRNLEFVACYGGLLELNSSGLRKKLQDPYPGRDFAQLAKQVPGTRFVLSDDAHAVSQVGVCYDQVLEYIDKVLKLDNLYFLCETQSGKLCVNSMDLEQVKSHPFWQRFQDQN
ncbi:LAMI_0A06436g1_1 [Lachancea mirantina]|uniref:Histidinol-phosphatase n=1 Tax=Lachancea mirantina TaxID=1230905 RepID=A0A1G4IQ51_9SACH|nr:LAMI_0A06436g1_1 [Lachancea mirantina]